MYYLYQVPVILLLVFLSHSLCRSVIMATATSVSLNVQDQTRTAPVAQVDHARLMYYLNCVSSSGPRPGDPTLKAPKKLTDHANYHLLSFQEIRSVVDWCHRLSPENVEIQEFVCCDSDGEVCEDPWKSDCAFLNISADYDIVSVGQRSIVAGSIKGIGERLVMFYTPLWLEQYYTNPLENVSRFHCLHCDGTEHHCSCVEGCDRPAKSLCHILRSNEHSFACDGCKDEWYVTGVLYRCTICSNYGLCHRCYLERQVDDLTHPFEEIVSPGATPRRLAPRKAPLLPPRPPVSSQSIANIKDLVWGRSTPPTTPQSYTNSGLPSPTMNNTTSTVPVTSSGLKAPFRKDDIVVLKGLTRAEMNGKEATVLSVDVGDQKVQIQVVGMDKTFKVKWTNVEAVEELEELEEELE